MAGIVGRDGERFIWVLDPVTRKLRVPMNLLVPTQATSISGSVPSLCLAFLENRCRHPWCRQAHVLPHAIQQLRHDALNAPTCCSEHGDPHDTAILTDRFDTVTISDSPHISPIPVTRVALTVGLQRYLAHSISPELRGGNLEIPLKLVCRLHQSQRCRYMEDCNNIHLCRELELRLMPPPHMMAPLSSIQSNTKNVTIGEQIYSVSMLAAGEVSDEEFGHICESHQKTAKGNSPLPGASPLGASVTAPGSIAGASDDMGLQSASFGLHDANGNMPMFKSPGSTPPLGPHPHHNGSPNGSNNGTKPTTPLTMPMPIIPTGMGGPASSSSPSGNPPPAYNNSFSATPTTPILRGSPLSTGSPGSIAPNITSVRVYDVRRPAVRSY